MKQLIVGTVLAAALGFGAAAFVPAQSPDTGTPTRRVALLVGINKYDERGFAELRFAENDVQEMERELIRLQFDKVVTMKGSSKGELRATKENIETQLWKLLKDIRKSDIVLVMLSGHGLQFKIRTDDGGEREDDFYCPVGGVLNQPESLISLGTLTGDWLAKLGGRNLVLVDASRVGVVNRNRAAGGVQGPRVSLPEWTAILFSCAQEQDSVEREDLKHGVFTFSAIEAFRAAKPNEPITWAALVNHIQNRVAELNPKQSPILVCSMGRLVLGRGASVR
jgi:uncharacterized caspase-like protein